MIYDGIIFLYINLQVVKGGMARERERERERRTDKKYN